MKTNREAYFELKNKNNSVFTEYVIKCLLCKINSFKNFDELFLHFDEKIKNNEDFIYLSAKIEAGEPFQYVLKSAYFLNDEFYVDENVLIPRQETEQLIIELIKKIEELQGFEPKSICDVCTGSGILGIELKKKYPNAMVCCSDIESNALEVAKINAEKHETEILFALGDLLEPLEKYKPFDILICNPPYIENIKTIDEQVYKFEPHKALLANPGTIYYERIFNKLNKFMNKRWIAAFEIGEDQKDILENKLKSVLSNVNYEFKIDLYGKDRILLIWKM